MFGNRALFHKAGQVHKELNESESKNKELPKHIQWLRRSYQQGKQISQIISYIWRWCEEESAEYKKNRETANQLRKYFAHPTQDAKSPMQNLKKLFAANAREPNTSPEAMLLAAVFSPINDNMIFPIFDKFELGEENPKFGYLFEIDVNSFQGDIADATVNDLALLKWVIPYPPRPHIGEVTVSSSELEEWINNTDQYTPQNPYIPSSSS